MKEYMRISRTYYIRRGTQHCEVSKKMIQYIPLLLLNRSFMTGFCAKWWQSKYLRKTKPVIMTGLYTNSLLNCLRKLLILTLFFQNENYNCLKYLFLINRCGKPNKIICFILYPFNIYTVLYLKIIIVGVFLFKNECKVFVI